MNPEDYMTPHFRQTVQKASEGPPSALVFVNEGSIQSMGGMRGVIDAAMKLLPGAVFYDLNLVPLVPGCAILVSTEIPSDHQGSKR